MKSGDIISFNYAAARRDNNPLVLITDITPEYVRGVNLHYLPYSSASAAVANAAGKQTSYQSISPNSKWKAAFRMYRRSYMRSQKVLNWDRLQRTISGLNDLPPADRRALQERINGLVASGRDPEYIPAIVRAALENPESL